MNRFIILMFMVVTYMKNDGIYVASNINNTELEWINKYAVYDTRFPEDTIIEEFSFDDDGTIPTFF